MRSISRCLIAGLALLVSSGIALGADLPRDIQVHGLIAAAKQQSAQLREKRALAPAERESVDRRIAQIDALLNAAELHRASLSPGARLHLSQALEALQSLPAAIPSSTKATTALGTITGTLTDVATSTGLGSVTVRAYDFSSQIPPSGAGVVSQMTTGPSGTYTLTLPPGKYHVRTINAQGQGYTNQVYGYGPCIDTIFCTRYVGTIVTVSSGGTAAGIDLGLSKGGQIQGRVKRASDSAPLAGATVLAINSSGFGSAAATTDSSGNYTITGLGNAQWRVYVDVDGITTGLLDQAYNTGGNTDCANDCDFIQPARFITISGTSIVTGINFSLAPRAQISGTVTDLTAAPLQNAVVTLISEDRFTNLTADPYAGAPNGESTDATGHYTFSQVRPGNFRVLVSRAVTDPVIFVPYPTHISRVYPSTNCINCDALTLGSTVAVPAGGNVTGINVALDPGASVSGTILRATDSSPVTGAVVNVMNGASGYTSTAVTNGSGNFTALGMPDGVAYVFAGSEQLAQTWLGDVVCQYTCSNIGSPINALSGTPVTGLLIHAAEGGSIRGTITDATVGAAAPSNRTRIEVFEASSGRLVAQTFQTYDSTTGTTYYKAGALAPGGYHAIAASSSSVGWIDAAYGTGLPCPRGGCDLSVLPTVYVTAGATTSPIDFSLPRGHTIRGQITDAATAQPIFTPAYDPSFSTTVGIYNSLDNYAGYGQIDQAGGYATRTGFAPGPFFLSTYLLRTNQPFGGGYVDKLYNGFDCPYGSCGFTTGTPLSIAGSDVTGIDLALSKGGAIAGTVNKLVGGTPLPGAVTVTAYNPSGRIVAVALSDVNGAYRLQGLPSGNYYVVTENTLGYLDKLYNNITCEPFCNPVTGTAVAVTAPATTSSINFALDQAATIQGSVMSGASGVANVPVEIYGAIGNLLRSSTTNAAGAYSFHDLAVGRYFVRTRNTTGRPMPCTTDFRAWARRVRCAAARRST